MYSIIPQERADEALSELLRRIACGEEYPDAQWKVSQDFKVPGEMLQEMYDAHCEGRP